MRRFRDAYTRNLDADQRGTRARNSEWTRPTGNTLQRRSMGVDTTYKLVLREHLGYLVDTRFNVEWYIEGGRSLAGAFEQRDHSA
jgi:hypothetical protein